MNSKQFNKFLKDPRTNWKYIVIVVILAVIVGGGILGYWWWVGKEEIKITEIKVLKKEAEIPEEEVEPALQPFIKLLSPNGGEKWIKGKNYVIQWNQKGLEHWGDVVTICLKGFDNEGNAISAKWEENLCYFYLEAYFIFEDTLTGKSYQWTIPKDISEKFERLPNFYKISLLVFDHLPPEGRTEWAGFIAGDDSDDYFSIIEDETANWKTYRNKKQRFEVKYPESWYLIFEEPNVEFASVPKNKYLYGVGIPERGGAWITFIRRDKKRNDGEKVLQIYNDIYIVEVSVFKEHNGLIYEIISSFYRDDPKENFYRGISDQILSTFLFF